MISDLTVASASGAVAVDHLDLTVRGGEIIVIAGVQGNGQSELAEALLGTMTPVGGTITLDDADITRLSPARTLRGDIGGGNATSNDPIGDILEARLTR